MRELPMKAPGERSVDSQLAPGENYVFVNYSSHGH
jgi:hypothetical protein